MLRRTLRKLIPVYAILPLTLTGLMNLLSYFGAKVIQCFVSFDAVDMTLPADAAFPFTPGWIVVYILTYIFWIYQYTTIARESEEMACRLATADFSAKIICFLFFIFLPTTNVRPAVEGSGVIPFLMRFIYRADTPTNLFPSIHCFVAWLGTRFLFSCRKPREKWLVCTLCLAGSLLVFASTLYTRQHVLLDVLGGVAVAEIGWLIARFTPLPRLLQRINHRFVKTKLCSYL